MSAGVARAKSAYVQKTPRAFLVLGAPVYSPESTIFSRIRTIVGGINERTRADALRITLYPSVVLLIRYWAGAKGEPQAR
jgi:hypothetical protein